MVHVMSDGKNEQLNDKDNPDVEPTNGVPSAANDVIEENDLIQSESEDPVAVLQSEVATLKDQLLRALAETENTRRRTSRENQDLIRYGGTNLVRDILVVADNLRRALVSLPEDARAENEALASLAKGVELTEKEFLSALERHNVRKIEPLGELFNHNEHQAMFEVENTGQQAGTIVELLQPGYLLHDRLLRPAMVGVAKGDPKVPPEGIGNIDTTG